MAVKVKLLVSRAGISFAQSRGEIVEVSAEEAERMIAAEQAVRVGDTPRTHKAIRKPAERAVKEHG